MAFYKLGAAHLAIILLALGQCGVAIAVIVVVRQNLWYWTSGGCSTIRIPPYAACWSSGDVCFMAKPGTSTNLCSYTYWVCGISFFISISLMFAQCFIRERRSYMLSTGGLTLAGSIWWIGFSITTTVYGVDANEAGLDFRSSRNAAWILGWVNSGLFLGSLVFGALLMCGCVAGPPPPQQPCPTYQMGPVGYQPGPYAAQSPGYVMGTPVPYPPQGYPQGYMPPPPGYPQQPYQVPPQQGQFVQT